MSDVLRIGLVALPLVIIAVFVGLLIASQRDRKR